MDENMSIMYKIVSAKNPDFVNKQFRVFFNKHNHEYRVVIFNGDVKRKCNFVKDLKSEDVNKFWKDSEIKYKIDKEYGKTIIEAYEKKASILRTLYEVLPDGVIDPLSISLVEAHFAAREAKNANCKSTDDQVNFRMEPNDKIEKGDI